MLLRESRTWKVQEADSLSSKVFLNILNPTSHSRYYICEFLKQQQQNRVQTWPLLYIHTTKLVI